MRLAALAIVVLALAACDSGTSGPTSSTSSSTTTIQDDTCDRVASDSVEFVEQLIGELDGTRLAEFRDQADWPDDLARLERTGTDLDIRVAALSCDPERIRLTVLELADLTPSGPLSEGIVEWLLSPPTTTTTTTTGPSDAGASTTGPTTDTTVAPADEG